MKYDNLTVNEFINEILKQDIPKLEMYNYVKRATNNFDETSLIYFLQEVGKFGNGLGINFFVEVEDDWGKYHDEKRQYSIGSYLTHYMFKLGEENASETQIKIIEEIKSTTNVERKTIAIEVLIPDVKIDGKYWNLIELGNMLESEYQKIANKPSLLPPQIKTKTKNVLPEKLIRFNKPETLNKLNDILKEYFAGRETDFKNALQGEKIEIPLLFPDNQNKFVEVFRRAKYNGFIISSLTEIKNWLCANFEFRYKHGKNAEIRKFNGETVWAILSKGQNEPPRKERICFKDIDWLPYKSKKQLETEAQEEQL